MVVIITCGHRPDDERIYGREIKSLLSAGYKITYFTRWQGECMLHDDNLYHRNYTENNLSIRDYTKGILNDLKVLKPTVVHIHEFELLPLVKKVKKLYNSTIIYDVHEANIELWDVFSTKPKALKRLITTSLNKFEKKYLKFVDIVFTTAPQLVERYQQRGLNSLYLPNYPKFFPKRVKKSDIPTIIYHGQISFERGIGDLIQAISSLTKDDLLFKVKIYGSERLPGTIQKLNKLISDFKLNQVVNIHEQIPHHEMLRELSKATISVIPFQDYPMFQIATPVKLFEAMWARCAIIASDLTAIRKLDEEFIEFYPPGDINALGSTIKKLLKNTVKCEQLGKIGEKLIQTKYNWKIVEPTLIGVYQKVKN